MRSKHGIKGFESPKDQYRGLPIRHLNMSEGDGAYIGANRKYNYETVSAFSTPLTKIDRELAYFYHSKWNSKR